MSSNGHLNGSRNGNGSFNGNGSGHTEPKPCRRHWFTNFWHSDARYIVLVYGCLATLIGGLILYNYYHPQPQPPPPDPRTVQVEKTIDKLYDAIDVLKDELPPDPEDERNAHDYYQPSLDY